MDRPGNWVQLEIGCGDRKELEDSLGLDIRRTDSVDIVADARMIPFVDECCDRIYSSHAIEHFGHAEVCSVINEWMRVLKPGGILEIRCPDLRARALIFAVRPSWKNVRMIYGEQDYPHNTHRCGFSYRLMKQALKDAGMTKIKRVVNGYRGIPFIPDGLHVTCVKGRTDTYNLPNPSRNRWFQ